MINTGYEAQDTGMAFHNSSPLI